MQLGDGELSAEDLQNSQHDGAVQVNVDNGAGDRLIDASLLLEHQDGGGRKQSAQQPDGNVDCRK